MLGNGVHGLARLDVVPIVAIILVLVGMGGLFVQEDVCACWREKVFRWGFVVLAQLTCRNATAALTKFLREAFPSVFLAGNDAVEVVDKINLVIFCSLSTNS